MTDDTNITNATTFYKSEADQEDYGKYNRLWKANHPEWKGSGKWQDEQVLISKDRKNVLDAIASKLELTDFQKEKAKNIIGNTPSDIFRAYPTAAVVLCACGISGRVDGRNYHPNTLRSKNPVPHVADFVDVAEAEALTYNELFSCWRKVSNEVDV